MLERGYDVTGRETVGEFKDVGFTRQVEIVANDLKEYFWREDSKVIANSFGAYLFLHAQAHIGEPYIGRVVLLSPIVGEFANDDQARPMNFIPPYPDRLLELAQSGKFSVPLHCEIHVGTADWQSCPNATAFGEMVGVKVNLVQGAGHMLPLEYVGELLNQWSK